MQTKEEYNDIASKYIAESVFHPYRFFTYTEAAKILRVTKYWLRKYAKKTVDVKRPGIYQAYLTMADLELLMIKRFEKCPGFNINEFKNDIGYGKRD